MKTLFKLILTFAIIYIVYLVVVKIALYNVVFVLFALPAGALLIFAICEKLFVNEIEWICDKFLNDTED